MNSLRKNTFNYFYKYKRKLLETNRLWTDCCSNSCHSEPPKKLQNLRVLFFGTDHFSLPSLQRLWAEQKSIDNLGVVTSFKSKSNPVKKFSDQKELECFDWPVATSLCQKYDIGVVVSFGHLIPESIISSFPLGMINVHASLLPRWRGAAPIIYAIMNGDKTTGVSIMKIEPTRFDIGDVLMQREIPLPPDILMPELHNQMATEGADLLIESLSQLPHILNTSKRQNSVDVTHAPKVTADLAEINWNQMTAIQVYNLYRALYSFKPVSTKLGDIAIKLIEIILSRNTVDRQNRVGSIRYNKDGQCLNVTCADGQSIDVHRLRVEGKKIMSAKDFNNGFLKNLSKSEMRFNL